MRKFRTTVIIRRPILDPQLWVAVGSGSVAILALVVMMGSLKAYPPPAQASAKADKLVDIGPRAVTVRRVEPIPRIAPNPEWWNTYKGEIASFSPPQLVSDPEVWPEEEPTKAIVKPKVKPDKGEDICARHKMHKVWINDKYWRCRKTR